MVGRFLVSCERGAPAGKAWGFGFRVSGSKLRVAGFWFGI